MNVSRKILGFALAVTLFATQFTAVMAYDDQPSTTPGKGGVLAHNVVDVTVPTTLKLAFNPNGYKVNVGYTKIASTTATPYSSTATYYEIDTSVTTKVAYKIKKVASAEYADAVTAGLYLPRVSEEQVVSLNYGIINKSTDIMDVTVDFAVTYDSADANTDANKKTIEFVESPLDAKWKTVASATLPTGQGTANVGETKMYLTAVSAASGITPIESYVRNNTYTDANTVYYYWDTTDSKYKLASTDGKFAAQGDFDTALAAKTNLFNFSQTINPYTRKSELADVDMTAATAGVQVFKAGTTNKADAQLIYALDKAEYNLKDGAFIEIGTTQDDLAANLELTAVPGYSAFTIAGYMNSGADWTKAETKSITISPTYTLTVADGNEEAITGTQKQVTIARAPSVTTQNFAILEAGKDATINVDLGAGTKAATAVAKAIWSDGNTSMDMLAENKVVYSNGVVTIKAVSVDYYLAHPTDTLEIVFDDDPTTPTSVVITLTAKP